jgi:hypothetical protein
MPALFTLVSSAAIVVSTQAAELTRAGPTGLGALFTALAAAALIALAALVVFGLIVMASK